MGITYDAVNNIITVVGETGSGDTEANAYDFEDVYQADVSGGWGVVSKQGNAQYLFDCRLVIGDGSTTTWFVDIAKQIVFSDSAFSANWQHAIDIRRYGYVRFGTLIDETTKTTREGVNFIVDKASYMPIILLDTSQDYNTHDRQLYAYSCSFQTIGQPSNRIFASARGGNHRFWNILIKRGAGIVINPFGASGNKSINIFNFVIQDAINQAALQVYNSTGVTIDKIIIASAGNTIWTQQLATFTIKNVYSRLHTRVFYGSTNWGSGGDAWLVNFDVDSWTFGWAATATGKVFRQYEFDLNVTDKDDVPLSGAIVTLKDKDNNQVFQVTTDANGDIATQTVSRGWYERTTGDTLNEYSPHTLRIEKSGYQTYEKKFTLNDKISWEIKLAKAVGVFLDFGRPVINLKKSEPENKNVMVL